jgi:hypothetical protein
MCSEKLHEIRTALIMDEIEKQAEADSIEKFGVIPELAGIQLKIGLIQISNAVEICVTICRLPSAELEEAFLGRRCFQKFVAAVRLLAERDPRSAGSDGDPACLDRGFAGRRGRWTLPVRHRQEWVSRLPQRAVFDVAPCIAGEEALGPHIRIASVKEEDRLEIAD